MKKSVKPIAVLLLALITILAISCSPDPSKGISETTTIKIMINNMENGLNTATIIPSIPSVDKYTLELKQNGTTKIGPLDSANGQFTVTDVPIGTYSIEIKGYQGEKDVLFGTSSIIVRPGNNTKPVTVTMNYLTTGEGAFSVDIIWTDLTTGNQIDKAINDYNALGFRALYAESKDPINGINDPETDGYIYWADEEDFANKKFNYIQNDIEPTEGTPILFQIWTKINGNIQLIAETFPTVLQIYPNLTSVPDEGERQNFALNADHIIAYLENISEPEANPNTDNPTTSVDITWTNPVSFDAGTAFHVIVTAVDQTEVNNPISEKSEKYTAPAESGTVTISGLKENHSYNIYFQVFTNEGYSDNTMLLPGVQPKIVVTGIDFTADSIKDSYVMGDEITISAVVTPDNASDKSYTYTITDGGTNIKSGSSADSDLSYTFPASGTYTITITSSDNPSVEKEITRDVKLAVPANFAYKYNEDSNSVDLSWNSVNSATGYTIIRTTAENNTEETLTTTDTPYSDTGLKSGYSYTYKIMATRTDGNGKYNSVYSSPTSAISVASSTINIQLPTNPTEEKLGNILANLKNESIVIGDESKNSIKISITNGIATNATYKWILNNNISTPVSTGKDVTITADTTGLKKNAASGTTSNSLMLIVTIDGKEYSTTGYFNVISNNSAGKLLSVNTQDSDGIVYYNTPEKLTLAFENSKAPQPDITWKSSNPEVMSVSQDGTVTTLKKGEPVTITATVKDNNDSKSITLNPYVKATGIEFSARDPNFLIIEDVRNVDDTSTGVIATNLGKSFNYNLLIGKPEDSEGNTVELSSKVIITTSDDGIISIDENGNIKPLKAGDVTITASIDGYKDSINVTVLDFDIEVNNSGWKNVTGQLETLSGNLTQNKYSIRIIHSNTNIEITSYLNFNWLFDNEKTSTGNSQNISGDKLEGEYRRGPDATRGIIKIKICYNDGTQLGDIGFVSRSSNIG